MGLPNVSILLQNGQLGGLVQYAEGVAGIVGTGVAVTDLIQLGDPRVVFNLQDAIDIGITEDDNPVAYRQVKEFYDEAGDGAELYIMLVPDTMDQTDMWDVTNTSGIVKLLDYAQGRVRVAASFFEPPVGYTLVVTDGLDADVFTALAKAQATGVAYFNNITPLRGLVEGRAFTDDAADPTSLRTMAYNRAGVVMLSTDDDGSASVGLALGRLAKVPVQRKISRVKDGPLNITDAYVGSTAIAGYSGLGLLHDKGYIVGRTFPGKTGYYFTGDPVAAPTTDDYCQIARGRVIDKAAVIAYVTYLEELDDEITVNSDGTLETGMVKYLEKKITDQLGELMVATGNCSAASCTINPAQNIITTNKLTVVLKVTPVGYSSDIEVQLGFTNPALS